MKNIQIYLDMDEVLVDFVGGVCALHNITKDHLQAHWPIGTWGMVDPTVLALGLQDVIPPENRERWFWDVIGSHRYFWENLKTLPWTEDVLKLVCKYDPDFHIVSSPSQCVTSYTGKVWWLKDKIGSAFNQFFLSPHKHLLAQPGTVLIDDREANVEKFVKCGGAGIVFPTHYNLLFSDRANPVKFVSERLEALTEGVKCI